MISHKPEVPLFSEATFERLLNRGHYGIIGDQLLFYNPELGKFVLTQINRDQEYDANDYAQLPESAPFQLINGKLIFMASPKVNHQEIAGNVYFCIRQYLKNHKVGNVLVSPMDVHFDTKNIVQPDVLYISIARKEIIEDFIKGAPDFVVEVLSPSNSKAEMEAKMALYGQYEVVEYWVIKPTETCVEVYHNHEKQMQLFMEAGLEDTIKSVAIAGFELEVKDIFE